MAKVGTKVNAEDVAAIGRTRVMAVVGEDEHVRPGIVLSEGSGASVDVLRPDGTRLCRLNLFAFKDGGGDVDVILQDGQVGTFLAWDQGREVVRQTPRVKVLAVDIR